MDTVKFEPPGLVETNGMDPGGPNEWDPTPTQVATQQNSRGSRPSRFRGANPENRKIVGGQCGHFQHHMIDTDRSYLIVAGWWFGT